MAINARSALESLTMFGLANDGPLNVGGLGVKKNPVTPQALGVPGITTADKLVPTPKPVKAKERIADTKLDRGTIADKVIEPIAEQTKIADIIAELTPDQRYKLAHAELIKERDRQRKAAKRADKKAKI